MRIGRILKWIGGIGALALVGWVLYKGGAFSPEKEIVRPVPTAKAEVKDIEDVVMTTGDVAPVDQTEIRSEVSAKVMQVQVTPGQRVQKDQPLLQLDRRELESQAKELQYTIAANDLRAQQSQKELDRDRDLIAKGFIPQKEYDDAHIAMMLAQNDLEVQRAKLETLRQQILKTDIRAPHGGIVLKLDAREGEVINGASSVSSGTVLMRIAELSKLKVNTRLNEVDVVKVRVNDKVELTFDAVPDKKVKGTVTYISPSADTGEESSSQSFGSSRRRNNMNGQAPGFETTVALDEVDDRIRPGITAHVRLTLGKADKAISVPLTAVFDEDEAKKHFVYLKTGEKKFERKDVELGISSRMAVEIKSGLKDGDVVATEIPPDAKPPQNPLPKDMD